MKVHFLSGTSRRVFHTIDTDLKTPWPDMIVDEHGCYWYFVGRDAAGAKYERCAAPTPVKTGLPAPE